METQIRFVLNGKPHSITTDPGRPLLEVLREDLRLTGPKFGCGEGECRACTVLINGQSIPSCLTPIGTVQGKEVLTIEGLADGDRLHPVQQAFLEEGAFQCGYCTAGMILGVVSVLKQHPKPTEAQMMTEMQRHLCRCCSYTKYKQAIRRFLAPNEKEGA